MAGEPKFARHNAELTLQGAVASLQHSTVGYTYDISHMIV